MGKFHSEITKALREFIADQKMFFTASAAPSGRVNLSPKGMDTFRCLDERTVAYLDLAGSGNETAAHLLADGRMTIMFCAFEGKPLILRLFGRGERVPLDTERGRELHRLFPPTPGERHLIVLRVESVQTSCGFGVPIYHYQDQRRLLVDWAERQGPEGMKEYRRGKNATSIDGLPTGLDE
jgi:hypothetical protein